MFSLRREAYFDNNATTRLSRPVRNRINQVLKALYEAFYPKKRKIISSPIEHFSVMSCLEYLGGKGVKVEFMPVDEAFLFDERNYVLDIIRFWHERKLLKSLPNSSEASFIGLGGYLHRVPRDKNVLLACMSGVDATLAAHSLRSRGFEQVGVL